MLRALSGVETQTRGLGYYTLETAVNGRYAEYYGGWERCAKYDPSAGLEVARAGGHSWWKVLGRYGRGQLREDEGDGQVDRG